MDVIVRSIHAKESVTKLEVMICHGLKYRTTLCNVASVHSLPRKWTIIPPPMHAFDPSKYTRKSLVALYAIIRDVSSSFGAPHIDWPKHCNHCTTKDGHIFKACRLNHAQIVIHTIYRGSIGKTPEVSCALLNIRETS
jgi:hypothetical protein